MVFGPGGTIPGGDSDWEGIVGWYPEPDSGLAPSPLQPSGFNILDVLENVSHQLSTYAGRDNSMHGPTPGVLRPAWVPEPTTVRNPVTGKTMESDPLDNPNFDTFFGMKDVEGDERVFMGKYVRVEADEEAVALQAGTEVSRAAIKGLQGTDDPMTSQAPTRKGPRKKDVRQPQTITVNEAMNRPYLWSQDKIQQVMGQFRRAGYEVADFNDLLDVWGELVGRASAMFNLSKGKREVTPWDVLEMYRKERKGAGVLGGPAEEQGFTGVRTQTHESVEKISEGDAWAALQGTVSSLLGRDPTEREVRDFAYMMNDVAARDPSISKSSTRYKDGIAQGSKTRVVDPGMTANDMAQAAYEEAQAEPNYAEYQAAATYLPLVMQALGPAV